MEAIYSFQMDPRESSPSRRIKSAPPSTGHRTPSSVSTDRPSRSQTSKPWRTSLPATSMTPTQELKEEEPQEAWVHQLRKVCLCYYGPTYFGLKKP